MHMCKHEKPRTESWREIVFNVFPHVNEWFIQKRETILLQQEKEPNYCKILSERMLHIHWMFKKKIKNIHISMASHNWKRQWLLYNRNWQHRVGSAREAYFKHCFCHIKWKVWYSMKPIDLEWWLLKAVYKS